MTFLVGAYSAAPADPASTDFGEFFMAIADHPLIGGLDLSSPHLGDPMAAAAIAESVGQEWVYAVTCFPGTMFCINDNPAAGADRPSRPSPLLAHCNTSALPGMLTPRPAADHRRSPNRAELRAPAAR